MKRHAAHGNRDDNEPEFTLFLRTAQIKYALMPAGVGADILIELAPMFFVEVKNPDRPPSKRALTDEEKALQAHCIQEGIGYHVLEHVEALVEIVNRLRA